MKIYSLNPHDGYNTEKIRCGLKFHQDFRHVYPLPIRERIGAWTGRYFGIKWWYSDKTEVYDTRKPYEEIPF